MNHGMLSEGTRSIIDFMFDVSWIVVIREKNPSYPGMDSTELFLTQWGVKGGQFLHQGILCTKFT